MSDAILGQPERHVDAEPVNAPVEPEPHDAEHGLEDRLAVWDGADDSLVFSSGMSAIATLLLALVSQNDVIVHSGPLYAASEGFVAKVLSRFGVTYVDFPAGATRAELDTVLEKAKAEAFARNQQAAKERKEAAKGGKGNKKPRQPVIPR